MNQELNSPALNKGIISWFVRNPVAANLLMLCILAAGLISALNLRVEGFPSVEPNSISVNVTYESGDAIQAEEGITIKIEEALLGVPGIQNIRSTSSTDGVNIVIERQSNYNLDKLNSEVKNRVDGIVGFPSLAEKPIISQRYREENVISITLYGNSSQTELQRISRNIEASLLTLDSVTKVNRSGWRKPEIAIEVNERNLQAYQLTLSDIANIINRESLTETNGELRSKSGVILLKADKQGYVAEDFANIIVKTLSNGAQIRIGDIARVTDGFEETPHIISRFNGKPAITLDIMTHGDSNIVDITEQAYQLVEHWQSRLPQHLTLTPWMDQSLSMKDRLGLMLENGLIGILLVVILLSIFLNIRIAFWVGVGLPVCFAGGLLLMGENFWDLSINQLTTFGFVLVLGILVDDAVVVGESVHQAHTQYGVSTESTILGVQNVAVPTMFGVLTTVAAFYPLSMVDGMLGSFFGQFAFICTACLIFSLIESKLILPAHLRHAQTKGKAKTALGRSFSKLQQAAENSIVVFNQRVYRPLIKASLRYRYAVLMLFTSLFIIVSGMIPSGKIEFQFFPEIPEEVITISYHAKPGTGYGVTEQQLQAVEQTVTEINNTIKQQYPEQAAPIQHYNSLITSDQSGSTTLALTPSNTRTVQVLDIVAQLERALKPQADIQELLVSADDFEEKDLEINVFSNDREQLNKASRAIYQELEQIKGTMALLNNLDVGQSQISFTLNQQGRALGMTTASLAQQVQQGFYGAMVQRIQRGKDELKIRVKYPSEQRRDISHLSQARVRTPQGHIVALTSVADLNYGYTATDIQRKNGVRYATVSANVDQSVADVDQVLEILESEIYPRLEKAYPSVHFESDGDAAEEQESGSSMILIFIISLAAIYILVAIPLKSYWQPLLIMSVIPFAIVGAILGHYWMGLPLSILSLFGFLALSGVVVNDSLLLVNRYNNLLEHHVDHHIALEEAGSQRMKAILLTTVTTCLGLVSLLQETSEQAQFLIPPATSLAFGICFATLITLILVPILLAISKDLSHGYRTLLLRNVTRAIR